MIERAVEILRAGGLVAFPTETVYGLGADARNPDAVAKIFAAKGRPATNPLIVHVADVESAKRYARAWPVIADQLAKAFWPGPLTVVVKKDAQITETATAGGDTVGLRVPNHPIALELLRAFDGPIAAPSANRSNRISPTLASHVRQELGDRVDLVLDGGPCQVGIESTVINITTEPAEILRPGSVTSAAIEAVIGPLQIRSRLPQPDQPALSPGQLATHYAPQTPAFWIRPDVPARLSGRTAILAIQLGNFSHHAVLQMSSDPEIYAREFYRSLRAADQMNVEQIVIELPSDTQEWVAIRDRILKAARPLKPESLQ